MEIQNTHVIETLPTKPYTCRICKKIFQASAEHIYLINRKQGHTSKVCSYTCMQKYRYAKQRQRFESYISVIRKKICTHNHFSQREQEICAELYIHFQNKLPNINVLCSTSIKDYGIISCILEKIEKLNK